MRLRKIMYIFVLAVFVLTACGKETEEKKEPTRTEQTDNKEDSTDFSETKEDSSSMADTLNDDEVQEPSNQAETNTNQSNKNDSNGDSNTTTGNTTTKPSTGNNENSGSGNSGSSNEGNSTSSNTGNTNNSENNSSSETTTKPSELVHEHNWVEVTEEKTVYYAWRTLCNVCKADLTDMTEDDMVLHVGLVCGGSYANYFVEVDYVTENVVKTPVVVGYKCSCGETKEE